MSVKDRAGYCLWGVEGRGWLRPATVRGTAPSTPVAAQDAGCVFTTVNHHDSLPLGTSARCLQSGPAIDQLGRAKLQG